MMIISPVEFNQISVNALDTTQNDTLATKEVVREYASNMSLSPLQSVFYNGKIYSATKQISSLDTTPDKSDDMSFLGASNSAAYLDDEIHTQSISKNEPLVIEIDLNGKIADTLVLLNLTASEVIVEANNAVVFKKSNTSRQISGWLDFFTMAFTQDKGDYSISLGACNAKVKITLKPTNSHAGLGKLIIGRALELGALLYEARVGEIDYSRRNIDMYGKTYIRQGKSAKYLSATIIIPTPQVDYVIATLRNARGQFRTFIGDERDAGIAALNIHGYIKDYEINIIDEQLSELNLNLDGVI